MCRARAYLVLLPSGDAGNALHAILCGFDAAEKISDNSDKSSYSGKHIAVFICH